MKVLVIGATGLIGSAVVRELASREHYVVAISRGEQLADEEFVTYRRVDVNSPDLAEHFEGVDAVVNAFNAGWQNSNYVEDFKRGSSSIIEAARQASVPYLLCVGGAGSLFVAPGVQLVDTPEFPEAVYPAASAARDLYNSLKERRDVNWAYLSPAAMFMVAPVSYERTGKYRIGTDDVLLDPAGRPADISVADMAVAIVDDIEQRAHLFARFTVASTL